MHSNSQNEKKEPKDATYQECRTNQRDLLTQAKEVIQTQFSQVFDFQYAFPSDTEHNLKLSFIPL